MRETFTDFLELLRSLPPRIIELPAKYFYALWVFVFALLLLYIFRGEPSEITETIGQQNSKLRYESEPEIIGATANLYDSVIANSQEKTRIRSSVIDNLTELEFYIEQRILGEFPTLPNWIANQFQATGIDRDKFTRRFDGDKIHVQRWRKSDTAPSFDDELAFNKLISSCYTPWKSAIDFDIKIKPYKTTIDGSQLSISLLVEGVGQVSNNNGRQATAIWQTVWNRLSGALQLESVSVLAQEEVAAQFGTGNLFLDCTESILSRSGVIEKQIGYGLDQWARRIPNIDIIGNHGLAIGDVNRDGLDDIYVCQPHGLPNLLLVQNPDGTVEDLSSQSMVDVLDQSHAALLIDIDNDRDQDLAITTDESLLLYSNTGKGEFQFEHRMAIGRGAQSLSAVDFDQDGDLDLFLCKFGTPDLDVDVMQFPKDLLDVKGGGRNVLLRNDEGWKFVDATEQVGLTTENRDYSKCAAWVDFDLDGDQDLYVANEFSRDRCYRNDSGWLEDVTEKMNINIASRHRTVSTGDFNQDGHFDFFVGTDAPLAASESLAVPKGSAATDFDDVKKVLSGESQIWFSKPGSDKLDPFFLKAPIFASESAFGSVAADLNNDGYDDVVVTNGCLTRSSPEDLVGPFFDNAFQNVGDGNLASSVNLALADVADLARAGFSLSGNQRNRCYLSIGRLGFANISGASGIDLPDDSRAVAATDWDDDGDTDLIMTSRNAPQLRFFCNQFRGENQFISFELVGTISNADAIGARIDVFLTGSTKPLSKNLQAGSGYLGQSSKRILFGIGKNKTITKAVVTWPNGKSETYDTVAANTRYRVVEGRGELAERTTNRFEISLAGKSIESDDSLPATGRSVFYPRARLPRLAFNGGDKRFYPLENIENQPLLAVFHSDSQTSRTFLKAIWKASDILTEKRVDCVGLYCHAAATDILSTHDEAAKTIKESRFPFRWGSLTPASIDKLKFAFGDWFSNQHLPELPFALLIDNRGEVVSYYPNDALGLETILADVPLVDQDQRRYRDSAAPIGGRWVNPERYQDRSRLITRLENVGYSGKNTQSLRDGSQRRLAYELCQMGVEFQARNELQAAKNAIEQAISIDRQSSLALVASGNLQRILALDGGIDDLNHKMTLQKQAAEDFGDALRIDPLNREAMLGKAYVLIDQNRTDDALQALLNYVKVAPDRFEIQAIIGRLYYGKQNYREAAKFMVSAFENRPSLPYVAGDLGVLYLRSGEYKQARKFLLLANRLQPSDKNIFRALAESEFVNGNFEQAVNMFEKVVEGNPTHIRSRHILAWLLATCPYESMRDGERSLSMIKPLAEVQTTSQVVLEIYAAGFAEIGDFENALSYQEEAIKLVDENRGDTNYTESQKVGMRSRVELYRRKSPYRSSEPDKNPILPPAGGGA